LYSAPATSDQRISAASHCQHPRRQPRRCTEPLLSWRL